MKVSLLYDYGNSAYFRLVPYADILARKMNEPCDDGPYGPSSAVAAWDS